MKAVTTLTPKQHNVTKNENPTTLFVRFHSPFFNQYVPADVSLMGAEPEWSLSMGTGIVIRAPDEPELAELKVGRGLVLLAPITCLDSI